MKVYRVLRTPFQPNVCSNGCHGVHSIQSSSVSCNMRSNCLVVLYCPTTITWCRPANIISNAVFTPDCFINDQSRGMLDHTPLFPKWTPPRLAPRGALTTPDPAFLTPDPGPYTLVRNHFNITVPHMLAYNFASATGVLTRPSGTPRWGICYCTNSFTIRDFLISRGQIWRSQLTLSRSIEQAISTAYTTDAHNQVVYKGSIFTCS